MFHRFIIGIGGLSVRVGGVVLGIGGIKDHMESRSVFCVMLEVVVGREQSVQMPLCWSVCLVFNLHLRVQSVWVCWKPPLSLSSCSARQKCWKTSLPEMQQTPVCQCGSYVCPVYVCGYCMFKYKFRAGIWQVTEWISIFPLIHIIFLSTIQCFVTHAQWGKGGHIGHHVTLKQRPGFWSFYSHSFILICYVCCSDT